ncbi:7914_t:CDS:2 [Racocetra persica]|uniref:7914_t:CDS:1 n=1 Tax=Racocetra persica TaxID=160502 RepID=A0ACA9P2C1_9GLOM|nr:7914_t:CDS:2 [Racocetra persica]
MVYLRLEGLKISDALISAILRLCPDIRFLILYKSKGFTNIPIIEIARFSPKLQHLSLNSCICLTNRYITEITHSCSKLRHLELGDCSIGNKAIEKIASNCTNLKYLSLKRCRRISNEVLKKLNLKIKIEHPDYSDNEFSDSDLPPLIPIFTGRQNGIAITRSFRDYYLSYTSDETDLISAIVNYLKENPPTRREKISVKALIDTSSKFNTISKSLFDKLKEDYGICDPVENLYRDVIGEIKCLDLQFCYKGKWRSLDGTEVIDFQIRKNPSFDLVLGQEWLWMREAKISFGYSSKTCVHHAKIVIDGMSISLIEENSNKASSSKNNLSHFETEIDKPDLNLEKFIDMFKKLFIETNLSSSDSESTGSDWYDLDLKKPRKKCIHNTKKKVISPSRKHCRNKPIRTK